MDIKNYIKQDGVWDKKIESLNKAQKLKSYYTKIAPPPKHIFHYTYRIGSVCLASIFYIFHR